VGQNVTVLTELDCLASCFISPVNLKGLFLISLYFCRAVKVFQQGTKRHPGVEGDEPCTGAFKGFNLFPDEKRCSLHLVFQHSVDYQLSYFSTSE